MGNPDLQKEMTISTVRRVSRIWSIISIGLILLLFLVDLNPAEIEWKEWVGLAFFPLGVVLGMIIGWRYEILGGAIATASLAAFYFIYGLILTGAFPKGIFFLLLSFPGILFLMIGLDSKPKS